MKTNSKKVIYVISEGEYSDRHPVGYVTSLDDAESYCVSNQDNGWYNSRSFDAIPLFTGIKQVKRYYRHEVVFDFPAKYRGFSGGMRKEPNRYKYTLDPLGYNDITWRGYGWVAFMINTESHDRALPEKIAQDLYAEFNDLSSQFGEKKAYEIMDDRLKRQRK